MLVDFLAQCKYNGCSSLTHVVALDRRVLGDRDLLDGASAQSLPLALGGEQAQLLLLILAQVVTIPEEQRPIENVSQSSVSAPISHCRAVQQQQLKVKHTLFMPLTGIGATLEAQVSLASAQARFSLSGVSLCSS